MYIRTCQDLVSSGRCAVWSHCWNQTQGLDSSQWKWVPKGSPWISEEPCKSGHGEVEKNSWDVPNLHVEETVLCFCVWGSWPGAKQMGTSSILLQKGVRAVGYETSSSSQVVCEGGGQDGEVEWEKKLFAVILLLVECQISAGHCSFADPEEPESFCQ